MSTAIDPTRPQILLVTHGLEGEDDGGFGIEDVLLIPLYHNPAYDIARWHVQWNRRIPDAHPGNAYEYQKRHAAIRDWAHELGVTCDPVHPPCEEELLVGWLIAQGYIGAIWSNHQDLLAAGAGCGEPIPTIKTG